MKYQAPAKYVGAVEHGGETYNLDAERCFEAPDGIEAELFKKGIVKYVLPADLQPPQWDWAVRSINA